MFTASIFYQHYLDAWETRHRIERKNSGPLRTEDSHAPFLKMVDQAEVVAKISSKTYTFKDGSQLTCKTDVYGRHEVIATQELRG